MKYLLPIVVFLSAAGLLHAESPVIGSAGGIEISTMELRENLAGLQAEQKTALAQDPAALAQYLRALLVQKLILKQASEQKWDQDPAVIARLVRARETAIAETFLEAKSMPGPEYPTDAEVTEAYEANKEKLLIPRSYQLAQIYIREPEGATAAVKTEAKEKLDAVVKKLAAKDADFAAVARKHSEDETTAAAGGVIGWLAEPQIQPAIRTALPDLSLGETSKPIRLPDGWHVLKVLDIREPRTPTLDEARERFIAQMRAERANIARQQFVADLLKKHPLAINEIELIMLAK